MVTECTLGFNQGPACGHTPDSPQWTFAGSSHAIHRDDTPLATGHVCSAAAGDGDLYQASYGPLYDANGHPNGQNGPLCGTWTPTTPTVSIAGVTVTEGSRAVLTISSSGGSGSGSVAFRTVNGTAVAPSDHTATSGVHTFSSTQLSKQVLVDTIDDSDVEGSESFTVVLSNPSGVDIGTGTATVTILDNDSLTVSISNTTVVEGEPAVLTITAVGGSGSGTVQYATQDGSAAAGSDYAPQSGVRSFSGPGAKQVTIPTIDDSSIEGTETFTVRLSNGSGLNIGTASATVTILDNDSAICPVGTTGTPPNCVPIVTLTGCAVSDTRLSSLTVTAGGSNVLSGFAATTYSYAVTADASSARVEATTASSAATVQISRGTASAGSASRTVYLSEGSTSNADVTVTSGGESCTYALEISRPGGNTFIDCPAGTILVIISGYSSCQPVADCPYDLYGFDPIYLATIGAKWFGPLWPASTSGGPAAVLPGGSSTAERTMVSCTDHFRSPPNTSSSDPARHCVGGYGERHLDPAGDCMKFQLSVSAVSPAGEVAGWRYEIDGCGYNRSADIVDTWTADNAVCASSAGWHLGPLPEMPPHLPPLRESGADGGPRRMASDSGWFDRGERGAGQPLCQCADNVAEVTDWGDLSLLRVTVSATKRGLRERRLYLGGGRERIWSEAQWTGSGAETASTVIEFPRRSGPPPADDVVEVNIADVAAAPNQFVDILRDDLLSNDACEIGLDCTDPLAWPMWITDTDATSCSGMGASRWMLATSQGTVGCDNLNSDSRNSALTLGSVRYWPEMWAAGEDTFTYSTYGGEATVTDPLHRPAPHKRPTSPRTIPAPATTSATFNSTGDGSQLGLQPRGWCIWCYGVWRMALLRTPTTAREPTGPRRTTAGAVPLTARARQRPRRRPLHGCYRRRPQPAPLRPIRDSRRHRPAHMGHRSALHRRLLLRRLLVAVHIRHRRHLFREPLLHAFAGVDA